MNDNVSLIAEFSAIPSWEGYEYQGHIALFSVLQKMEALIDDDKLNELCNFKLEVEGAEDFSILCKDKYLSLHQVKSASVDLKESDKFCFVISLLQFEAENGFFHISSKHSLPDDFIKSTVNQIDKLLVCLEYDIRSKSEVSPAELDSYIILEHITANSPKGSLYAILKLITEGKNDKSTVEKAVDTVKIKLNNCKQILFDGDQLKNDNCFLLKSSNSFDNIFQIKQYTLPIIKSIIEKIKPEIALFACEDSYLLFVYDQLLLLLKNEITKQYINSTAIIKKCIVNFIQIFNYVISDYHSEFNSVLYQYYLVWHSIQEVYDQFPANEIIESGCQFDNCAECENTDECNLFKQIDAIHKISKSEMRDFIYKLLLKTPEKGKTNDLPDNNLIRRLFVNILKTIPSLNYEINNIIQTQKDGKFYRLTLDNSAMKNELLSQLKKEASNSMSDKLLLYESDVLITEQLDEPAVFYNEVNSTTLGAKEYAEIEDITKDNIEKVRMNYNKSKVMRLISRNNAEKELNE